MTERFEQVASIFDEVASAPTEVRSDLLDAACAGDDALRAEVESLLRHHLEAATADHLLADVQANVAVPELADDDDADGPMPDRIATFRPIERIGAGGMGVVYRALQEHPERSVALKVIRSGLLSRSLLRRFEYEADLLARVNHPGIAQVYEAGVDDGGDGPVPYIAMEYIEGAEPVTVYAERAGLDSRAIVELFTRVCDAVEHGHRRGIIHRDLKPSNILVAADGQPKVIDFGVARAADLDRGASMRTMAGQLVGTLAYMSPEAVRADPDEVDTRTDVYGLGVVLFELLTRRLPCPVDGLPLPEAARRIADRPAPAPSSLVSTIDPALRGDLDTITLRMLEKDRDRRYATVGEVAEELRRTLRGEAINARRDSWLYVARRFAARHSVALSVGALVLATVLTLTASAAWQYHQRSVLEATSREMLAYANWELDDPFRQVDLVPEDVDGVRAYADAFLEGHDDLEAMMRSRAGLGYSHLLHWSDAEPEFRRALEIQRQRFQAPHEAIAVELWNLANTLFWQGRLDDARALYEECLAMRIDVFGGSHVLVADAITGLAACDRLQGDLDAAERRNREVVAMQVEHRTAGDPWIAASLNNLAVSLRDRGAFDSARASFEEAVALIDRLDVRPGFRARGRCNIATCWLGVGAWQRAEALAIEAEQIVRLGVGEDSPDILPCYVLRARCALQAGQEGRAVPAAREAVRACEQLEPESVHDAQLVLAEALLAAEHTGDLPEAAALAESVHAHRVQGTAILGRAEAAVVLAEVRVAQGRNPEAADLCRGALDVQAPRLLPEHPALLRTRAVLAEATRGE